MECLKLMVYHLSNNLFEPYDLGKPRKIVCDEILKWFQMGDNYLILKRILSNRIPTIDAFAEGIFRSALTAQDRGISKIFLQSGVNPNIKFAGVAAHDRFTPLQLAILTGNLGITELLLDFGADMHAVGMLTSMECGQSPLQIACRKGEVGIAMLLISRGAAVDMPVEFGPSALQSAAQTGNLEITTLLLENGADVNAQFGYLGCALECAIRARATNVVELLLKRGANANGHWKGKTPLQSAVMIDDEPMVKRLLQLGADVNAPAGNRGGRTALQWAAENGNLDLCQTLLNAGAHVNAAPAKESKPNQPKTTALAAAVSSKTYQLVELLLKQGADINDCRGERTALEAATELNDLQMVQLLLKTRANAGQDRSILVAARLKSPELILALLDAGADINKLDEMQSLGVMKPCSALCSAVCTNDINFVEFLLSIGAQPDAGLSPGTLYSDTPLVAATRLANVPIIERLLNAGANVNLAPTVCSYGLGRVSTLNALQTAARMGNLGLVQLLLNAGADLDWPAAVDNGRTALQVAVEFGNSNLTKFLIGEGADVNSPAAKTEGLTALQAAVSCMDVGLVQLLLDAGAKANDLLPGGGSTALKIAAANGANDIIEILHDNGADVNWPPERSASGTALQVAVEHGHYHTVQLLLARGADVNAPASYWYGDTAIQAAASRGYLRIAELLLNAGADVNAPGAEVGGSTALEAAAQEGRLDILKFLVNAGAKITGNGRAQFQRAMELATENGHDAVAKFLKYHQIF